MKVQMQPIVPDKIFVTGTGTGIGKTVVSAILARALEADYWKPVQAGFSDGTDSEWIKKMLSGNVSIVHPEIYKLKLPASPHIAARAENTGIDLQQIISQVPFTSKTLIIEGAGGVMVPLNEKEFVIDLIKMLNVKVVLVSRNVLGSINHSLLTAIACKKYDIPVLGWIFNDNYLEYEQEIVKWTGYPRLASIPFSDHPDETFIASQADALRQQLQNAPW